MLMPLGIIPPGCMTLAPATRTEIAYNVEVTVVKRDALCVTEACGFALLFLPNGPTMVLHTCGLGGG